MPYRATTIGASVAPAIAVTPMGTKCDARLDRAHPEHALHRQSEQEEHPDERGAVQQLGHVAGRDAAVREQPQRHERGGRARLDGDERREQRDAGGEQPERAGRAPAVLVGADDGVHQGHEAEGRGQRAGDVVRAAPDDLLARLADEAQDERHDRDRDRHVDEEDPLPADRVDQDAAGDDAEVPPRPASDAQMPIAVARSRPAGNVVTTSASAAGDMSAAPKPCTARAPTRSILRGRETARQRGDREQADAGEEDAAAAEEVAEPAAQEQEAAEEQGVGVDHPLEVRRVEAEVGADRGQRDVHDRRVQHDHELRDGEHGEDAPTPWIEE